MHKSEPVPCLVDGRETIPAEIWLRTEGKCIDSDVTSVKIVLSLGATLLGHVADAEVVLVAALVEIDRVVDEEVQVT